MDTRYP